MNHHFFFEESKTVFSKKNNFFEAAQKSHELGRFIWRIWIWNWNGILWWPGREPGDLLVLSPTEHGVDRGSGHISHKETLHRKSYGFEVLSRVFQKSSKHNNNTINNRIMILVINHNKLNMNSKKHPKKAWLCKDSGNPVKGIWSLRCKCLNGSVMA